MRRIASFVLALCGGCLAPIAPPTAGVRVPKSPQDRSAPPAATTTNEDTIDDPFRVYVGLGVLHSDELSDALTADTHSTVDPWALSFELGFVYYLDRVDWFDWGIGFEASAAVADVDGESRAVGWFTQEEGGSMTWSRYTPTAVLRIPFDDTAEDARSAFTTKFGVGWYSLSIDATQTGNVLGIPSYGTRNLLDESAFGSFVGIGFEFLDPRSGAGAYIDGEVHFVEFDTNEEFEPPNGTIGGQTYVLQIGFVKSF